MGVKVYFQPKALQGTIATIWSHDPISSLDMEFLPRGSGRGSRRTQAGCRALPLLDASELTLLSGAVLRGWCFLQAMLPWARLVGLGAGTGLSFQHPQSNYHGNMLGRYWSKCR